MGAENHEPLGARKWLGANKRHTQRCHRRWLERRNRKHESADYREDWASQRCTACRYWIPVVGLLTETWGACSNPTSAFDRTARFAHDGCDQFAGTIPAPRRSMTQPNRTEPSDSVSADQRKLE